MGDLKTTLISEADEFDDAFNPIIEERLDEELSKYINGESIDLSSLLEPDDNGASYGLSNGKATARQELDKRKIEEAKKRVITDMSTEIADMIRNNTCRSVDVADYTENTENIANYTKFLFSRLYVPSDLFIGFTMNKLINGITSFRRYTCYDSPSETLPFNVPERVVIIGALNKMFNFEFMNVDDYDHMKFYAISGKIAEFVKANDVPVYKFEHEIVDSMLGKLMLCLNTTTELGLREANKITVDYSYKQAILPDIIAMQDYSSNDDTWKAFIKAFLSVGGDDDRQIYVNHSYAELNKALHDCYTNGGMATLLGCCLKCYLPSISLSYFYAVQTVCLTVRLLSIFFQKVKATDKGDCIRKLSIVAYASSIIYESRSHILKQSIRTLPTSEKPISEESKMYIIHHLLVSGPYYLIKMLEESIPVLAAAQN